MGAFAQGNATLSRPNQITTCDGTSDDCTHGHLWWKKDGCGTGRICCSCRRTRASYSYSYTVKANPSPVFPSRTVTEHVPRYDSGLVAKCAREELFARCQGRHSKP